MREFYSINKIAPKAFFLLLLLFCNQWYAEAQDISSEVFSDITVCGDEATFDILYANATGVSLTGQVITVTLPVGIQYVPGSILESSSFNVRESNITDLGNILLEVNDLPNGQAVDFSINVVAKKAAIAHQQAGNVFRHEVSVQHSTGNESHTSASHNLLFAALNIVELNPSSIDVEVGDTYTRSIRIVNAGNGAVSTFDISDTRVQAGVDLLATDIGTLTGDIITLSGSDFSSIGNGNTTFDTNESITVTQTLRASGCEDATVSSAIAATWGCDGEYSVTSNSYAHTVIDYLSPNINLQSNASLDDCYGDGSASGQEIILTNSGSGIATNISIDIFKSTGNGYDQGIYSKIDEQNITYSVDNGAQIPIVPTSTFATDNAGDYACLGAAPVGRVLLDLPDIAAGQSITIYFNTYNCTISACADENNTGWEYEVDYNDFCQLESYSKSSVGQEVTNVDMSMLTESPTDIYNGERSEFRYTVASHTNELPEGDGAHYRLRIQLPTGLKIVDTNQDILFQSGPSVWTASSIVYDAPNGTLEAQYPMPAPFTINKSEVNLFLTADCSAAVTGQVDVSMSIDYATATDCTTDFYTEMVCDEVVSSQLHCPGGVCEGMSFYAFDIERTSFGSPDNNQDGNADASGSLDFTRVKLNRVMVGDTFRTVHYGVVNTSVDHPSWSFGYASSQIEAGQNLMAIGASVRIYDASTLQTYTCDGITPTGVINGEDQTFTYDFSTAVLSASCPALSGYEFEQGDSVLLYANYEVTGNIGGAVREITASNEYYLSDIAQPTDNADKYECDSYSGNITLIGYFFRNESVNRYTISACSREVIQHFKFSVGPCCGNYDGGNLFPYEYRQWSHVGRAWTVVPDNYELINTRLRQSRTIYTNNSATQTLHSIIPDLVSNDTLYYNLAQYFENNGGSLKLSDDGYEGELRVEIAPTCDVPVNTYQDMPFAFTFERDTRIGGGETDWYTASPDQVRFSPTTLGLSSANPVVDGIEKTVTWNLRVKNNTNNSEADNVWLYIVSPTGEVNVEQVRNASDNSLLTQQGELYTVGAIGQNATRQFNITASYSACSPDYIQVYAGYECSGYPTTFESFTCPVYSTRLDMEPKPVELQVTLEGEPIGDVCNREVEVTIEVASTKLAMADSIQVKFILPNTNGIAYKNGSSAFLFPLTGSFQGLSDPILTNGEIVFNTWEISTYIAENGLPGVLNLDSNRFQLKARFTLNSDYRPGDFILAEINGQESCGAALPTKFFAYDPTVKFEENTTAGLTDDISDSWSAAWVDYDNDGFEDLFVPEYNPQKGNLLYKNNGDGTFSKVTTGPLVEDRSTATGSTWADYDNDGDIDVFVSNQSGGPSFLYNNNGDGTFTKAIQESINTYDGHSHTPSWVDYDNDGYLDLFVTGYFRSEFNRLYKNDGSGNFTVNGGSAPSLSVSNAIGATWADYDNDRDMDLFIPNIDQDNILYRNDGNGDFTQITEGSIVQDGGNSVGASWGDYDNDGFLDLFVANAGNENNFLYRNNGDGTFTKVTSGIVVNDRGHSHGSAWGDFNNDGFLDLFVANDQNEVNFLYTNNGDGTFAKTDNAINYSGGNSFGSAWGDPDNDGDLDLFIAQHSNQTNTYFTNSGGSCNSKGCFTLQGTRSNRSGIGAKIRVKATVYNSSVWQVREVSAQTGGGSSGQSTLRALFGLGDAAQIDSVIVEWPSGTTQYLVNQPVNGCVEIIEETDPLVCGKVYHDANGNGAYDVGETAMPGVEIRVEPLGMMLVTDEQGDYRTYLGEGQYTLSQVAQEGWAQSSPVPQGDYQLSIVPSGEYCGNDFGNTPTCNEANLQVSVAATAFRRGFRNVLVIVYENKGSKAALDTELSIHMEEGVVAVDGDPEWDGETNGPSSTEYTWDLGTVAAFEKGIIYLTDSISLATTNGDSLSVSAVIAGSGADCDMSDNLATAKEEVVGSFDPNDKLVFPRGGIGEGDSLTYTIRFQNVGNYYASRVIIIDTLSQHLDTHTLEITGLSHNFRYNILKNNVLKFEAYDIHLPDSTTNEPESHGFVKFRIKPKVGVWPGTEIKNRAAIQFDFNKYLITNIVVNKFNYPRSYNNELLAYPNPNQGTVTLKYLGQIDGETRTLPFVQVDLKDRTGKTVLQLSNDRYFEPSLDLNHLPNGYYVVGVKDQYGQWAYTQIIKN